MERTTVKKGFILKDIIQFDEQSIDFHHECLQFPISLRPFGWKGFIGQETSHLSIDEKLHYFKGEQKLLGKLFSLGNRTLYLSQYGRYDTLPISEEELANDDKDDFTFLRLQDKTEQLDEVGTVHMSSRSEEADYDEDLYLKTDTKRIRLPKDNIEQLFEILEKSSAQRLCSVKKVGSIFSPTQDILAYDNDWAFYVRPKMFGDSEIDSTPIRHMAFMLKNRPLFILFWKKPGLYCGYHRQINIKEISNSNANEFCEWCRERAPRITEQGESYKSSGLGNPFSLWRWIHPDNITISNSALIYTRRTFHRDEMIYLPFQRISLFLKSKGFFTSRFEIFGEQNIIPKYSFSHSSVDAVINVIEKHCINVANGRSWHSWFLNPKNWFGRAPRLVNIDNRLVYYPKRIKSKMKKKYGMKIQSSVLEISEINRIVWHKEFFALSGTIEIHGSTKNIREDQNNEDTVMIVPNVSVFKYRYLLIFSGSLRTLLEQSSVNIKRKYKKFTF